MVAGTGLLHKKGPRLPLAQAVSMVGAFLLAN